MILLTAIGITALMARTAAPAHAATTDQVPARASAATAPLTPAERTDIVASTKTTADTTGTSLTHPAEAAHTVVAGDNLYAIAEADYGNGKDWKKLYVLNAGHAQSDGEELTNPDLIKPGWILETTDTATAPTTSSTPRPSHSAPDTGHTAAPNTPASAPTPSASPARDTPTSSGADTRATPDPSSTASTPALERTHAVSVPEQHRPAPSTSAGPHWTELAEGGALAASVLAALTLALARARRRRRWHGTCYWPTPGQHQPEPLTVPVPLRPASRSIPAAQDDATELDEFGAPTGPGFATDQQPDPTILDSAAPENAPTSCAPAEADEDRDPRQVETGPATLAVAAVDGRILALQDFAPALALNGPGALGAARAIAAAVLSAAELRHDGARLLISGTDAALLLDVAGNDLPAKLTAISDLELFDDGHSALAQLEQYTAYRTRMLEEHEADTLEQLPDEDDFPPVVLIAVARPETARRVSATVQAGAGLRVHAVLLGEHPSAQAWHVDTHGHLTGPDTTTRARTFQLSAAALSAALELLAEATGDASAEQGLPIAPDPLGELAIPEPDPGPAEPSPDEITEPAADSDETAADNPESAPVPETDSEVGTPTENTHAEAHGMAVIHPVRILAPDAQPASEEPARTSDAGSRCAETGPLLLVAAESPDPIKQIIDDYAAHPVRIKVLGVRAITTPTGTVDARLRSDAWRAATKLAVAGRYGQHLDDLAVLWPDHDDQALRVTVKNAVYDLRKTLRQRCGDPAGNPGRYITQANHRYIFNDQTVAVDLAAFTALRTLAARTRDVGERTAAARAALDLYDGDLLAGEDEEWMIAPRTKARRDALATATLLAQLADHAEDREAALGWWERALDIDDNEEVYRQIITTQLSLGHHADALATCDLLTSRLNADELAPAPETLALIARARGRRTTPSHTAPTPLRGYSFDNKHHAGTVRVPQRQAPSDSGAKSRRGRTAAMSDQAD